MSGVSTEKKQKKPQESKKSENDFKEWVALLYKTDVYSDEDLKTLYEQIRYQGFNREDVLLALFDKFNDVRVVVQIIIICALQGPQRASKAKLPGLNRTLMESGIPGSTSKGGSGLSCGRINAATADLAASYLKRLEVPKRVLSSPLPGWLQFPSAGAIKLPPILREQHIEFSKTFSKMIKGEFNEQIYSQMIQNAYYDEKLRLFE
jgi:hypothetical protein